MRKLKPLERQMLSDIEDGNWHNILGWPMDVTELGLFAMIRVAWATRFLKLNGLIDYKEEWANNERQIWVRITKLGRAELHNLYNR